MKVAIYNPFYKKVIILPIPFFVSSTLKIDLIIETEFGFILLCHLFYHALNFQ